MINLYQNIARSLKSNAKYLLDSKNIDSSLREIGDLYYTGSFALDLMTWNDIDMQVVLKSTLNPIEALSKILALLSKDPDFIEAQLIHFKDKYKPKMPRGVYLGVKMDCPDQGGIWKFDIWSLAKHDFEKNRELIENLRSKLDERSRNLILELKHEMMNGSDRVPQMGSHFLYQAILLEGIKEKNTLYEFLAARGISLSKNA